MSTNFTDRRQRLRASLTRANPVIDQALLQGYALTPVEISGLQHVVCDYLWHSAFEAGMNLEMPDGPAWFARNAATIRKLPNVTPNGVVMPKAETTAAYNLMHRMVATIVGKDLDPREVGAVFAPINVRIVDGTPNAKVDARPRASTKLHSDIWAAEPSPSVTIFLTVMGDTDTTTVEFYEPQEFPAEYQHAMKDFLDGGKLADGAVKYPPCFRNNHLLVMDSFCLHKTIKTGGDYRVSLDFRILLKNHLPSDAYMDTPRIQNYLPLAMWSGLGLSHMLAARLSIKEPVPDITTDAFAARFDVTGL